MKIIGFILLASCFLIALALGAQNQQLITFNYLLAQGDFRLSMLLGGTFTVGFVIGAFFCGLFYIKSRMSTSMLKKQVAKQRAELEKLRLNPIKE